MEKVDEFSRQSREKQSELDELKRTTPEEIWETDLAMLSTAISEQEAIDSQLKADDSKFKVKRRESMKTTKPRKGARKPVKSKPEKAKVVKNESDDSISSESSENGDSDSDEWTSPRSNNSKKTSKTRTTTKTKSGSSSQNTSAKSSPTKKIINKSSSPVKKKPKQKAVTSQVKQEGDSPRPNPRFNLADRLKIKSTDGKHQQTLEEMLNNKSKRKADSSEDSSGMLKKTKLEAQPAGGKGRLRRVDSTSDGDKKRILKNKKKQQ